ncbi:MAG TPA: hypothetical protein VHR45_12645 [Thermoanaerobaculia bacterium]|nr:hypothetical protein [Thermoanaerobaculia bacterium]
MKPRRERLRKVIARVVSHLEERYRIPVTFGNMPPPFIGDLDGREIFVDQDQNPELTLFTLVHLFGHTVQWNLSGHAPDIGTKEPRTYSAEDLVEVAAYERDASRYGLKLLHDIGAADLDQWLADFSAADTGYLLHYYTTGEKGSPVACWRSGQPLLEPLEIPAFTPIRFRRRLGGVVI